VLIDGLQQVVADYQLSSAHVLFPAAEELALLQQAGWLIRHGVQFHWQNQGYADFDAFLAALSQSKRKKIRQERRKVRDAGITIEVLWCRNYRSALAVFERCYRQTYLEHRSPPYLNLDFFRWWVSFWPATVFCSSPAEATSRLPPAGACKTAAHCMAVTGVRWKRWTACISSCAITAASNTPSAWPAMLRRRRARRTQTGARLYPGADPSAHWIAHPQFRRAIADWLAREREAIGDYQQQLFTCAYKNPCTTQ
jgi:predicted N-acyltransferase